MAQKYSKSNNELEYLEYSGIKRAEYATVTPDPIKNKLKIKKKLLSPPSSSGSPDYSNSSDSALGGNDINVKGKFFYKVQFIFLNNS